jgi:hypothetical protein
LEFVTAAVSRRLERSGHHSPDKRPGLVLQASTNQSKLARFDDAESAPYRFTANDSSLS